MQSSVVLCYAAFDAMLPEAFPRACRPCWGWCGWTGCV